MADRFATEKQLPCCLPPIQNRDRERDSMNVLERFEAKFTKGNGCWEWTAQKDRKGYGKFCIANKKQGAHRVAYQLYVGEIVNGLHVLHHCDNPSCVNPSHLFLGTNADNVHDSVNKGRCIRASGEKQHLAKLKEEQVRIIRERRNVGDGVAVLAKEFGVSEQNIRMIVRFRTWKSI